MNGVDIFSIVLLAIFSLRGLLVGFVKEILSLVGLIIAIFVSLKFSDLMTFYLKGIKDPLLLKVASILILFVLVIFLTQLVIFLIRKALKPTFVGVIDKLLGFAMGFFEGFIVCGTILYFAGRFDVIKPFLDRSKFSHKIASYYERYALSYFGELKEFFSKSMEEKP
ncbi:MAG: CvpA family protein [Candidatus Hydrothermia bacterium]